MKDERIERISNAIYCLESENISKECAINLLINVTYLRKGRLFRIFLSP